MVLHGIINVHGVGFGSQDTMNFNFFQVSRCVFLQSESKVWVFLRNIDFFPGQLYGCQVTINSIYAFDMVVQKRLR